MEFVVTSEMLKNAEDYVPLIKKTMLAKQQAEMIVQRSAEQTGIRGDDGNILPLPPRYFADEAVRSVMEMSIFCALYLKCEPVSEDGNIEMTIDTYDKYAGSHIFGQITAMKGSKEAKDDPELRAKIINILTDFNDYQRRLTAEIRALMTMYNDPVDRFIAMNAAMTTPETMQGLLEELKDAAEAVDQYKAEKDGVAE